MCCVSQFTDVGNEIHGTPQHYPEPGEFVYHPKVAHNGQKWRRRTAILAGFIGVIVATAAIAGAFSGATDADDTVSQSAQCPNVAETGAFDELGPYGNPCTAGCQCASGLCRGVCVHGNETLDLEQSAPPNNGILLPAVTVLADGVFASLLDLGDMPKSFSAYPIFAFARVNCDDPAESYSYYNVYDGQNWCMPSALPNPTTISSSLQQASQSVSYTYHSLVSQKTGDFSISGSYSKLSGSYSSKIKQSIDSITNHSRTLTQVTGFCESYQAGTQPVPVPGMLELDPTFLSYLSLAPAAYEDDPLLWLQIVGAYGTHYFRDVELGGRYFYTAETEESYDKTTTRTEINKNANADYGNFLSITGATSSDVTTVDENYLKNSYISQQTFGGMPCTTLDPHECYSQWVPTIQADPYVLSGHLDPISKIVPVDKAQAYEDATAVFMMQHQLSALQDLLPGLQNLNQYTLYGRKDCQIQQSTHCGDGCWCYEPELYDPGWKPVYADVVADVISQTEAMSEELYTLMLETNSLMASLSPSDYDAVIDLVERTNAANDKLATPVVKQYCNYACCAFHGSPFYCSTCLNWIQFRQGMTDVNFNPDSHTSPRTSPCG
jgi:hypothetical protein